MDPNPNNKTNKFSKPGRIAKSKFNWRGRGGWYQSHGAHHSRGNPTVLAIPNQTLPVTHNQIPPSSHTVPTSDNNTEVLSFSLDNSEECPGWKLYFSIPFSKDSKQWKNIKTFKRHYENHQNIYNYNDIIDNRSFLLSFQHLHDDSSFTSEWSTFQQDLIENPDETLNCAGIAMYQIISSIPVTPEGSSQLSQEPRFDEQQSNLHLIRARINNPEHIISLSSLRASSCGRLVSVRGTIMRSSPSQIMCTWLAFECGSCGAKQAVKQINGIMTLPKSCCSTTCRARSNFKPLLKSPYTQTESFQIVRLQESMGGTKLNVGSVPRNIEISFYQDLVDIACPGDEITVTGIPKVRSLDDKQKRDQASLYKMYLQGVSVLCHKNFRLNRRQDFNKKDIEAFEMIKSDPCPFRLLVHSLCPAIYGHEMIKAGLLLSLFGGSNMENVRRSNVHCLVVGDPGMGKSQMLLACTNVSPRGLFVSGTSSTIAGLTVSVRHEKDIGSTLEAGALVLADRGICCIDEFDKMTSNHHALLEVMEQQTVSITKAGVQCSLPARTSVLAAANPAGGFYNQAKTVSENLKMNPALLSRFDLIFILVDRPNAERDSLMTAHIQALHAQRVNSCSGESSFPKNLAERSSYDIDVSDAPLIERLTLKSDEKIDVIPTVLMQKYIAYTRKNVQPKLSTEAAELIKSFYLELRQLNLSTSTTPVTIRQLEAFVRLTQARAKLELCTEATVQHAHEVIEIVRFSLNEVLNTNVLNVTNSNFMNTTKLSQGAQIKRFLQMLQSESMALGKTVFTLDELREITVNGGINQNFINMIDKVNAQGILLKKGRNLYKYFAE